MPGSVAEMNNFQEIASAAANLSISCYFPELKLNLQDKETFEVIYNRYYLFSCNIDSILLHDRRPYLVAALDHLTSISIVFNTVVKNSKSKRT